MTTRRSSSNRRGSDDLDHRIAASVRAVIGEIAQEERDRRDPEARRDRLFDRMERFLDGFEAESKRGQGQRRDGEDQEDDDDEGDEPGVIELLAGLGGGGRGRR